MFLRPPPKSCPPVAGMRHPLRLLGHRPTLPGPCAVLPELAHALSVDCMPHCPWHPGLHPRATCLCWSRAPPATWHWGFPTAGPWAALLPPPPRSPPLQEPGTACVLASRPGPPVSTHAWVAGTGASCPAKSPWLQSREDFVLFMAHAPRGSRMFRTDPGPLARACSRGLGWAG